MNEQIFFWLQKIIGVSPAFDHTVKWVAASADKVVLALAAVCLGIFFITDKDWKNRKWVAWGIEGVTIITSVGAAWIVSEVIKNIVQAPRPFIAHPDFIPLFYHEGYDSFPSGHATAFFALAAAIYYYHRPLGIVFFIFAFLISISRVLAGIHYPEDILAGAIIGIIIGRLVFIGIRKIFKK